MVGEVFVERDRFGIARQLLQRRFYDFRRYRRGIDAVSFWNSLAKPGSLNDFAMASGKIWTSSFGVPGGRIGPARVDERLYKFSSRCSLWRLAKLSISAVARE